MRNEVVELAKFEANKLFENYIGVPEHKPCASCRFANGFTKDCKMGQKMYLAKISGKCREFQDITIFGDPGTRNKSVGD